MKIQVSIEVEKETYELGQALAGLVASVKAKAADGLTIPEVVAAISENVSKLTEGVMGIDKIPAELAEDKEAFANAAALMGSKILAALMK
jgi:hypothetical protein